MAEATPMMRQYKAIKEQHSDCILFFRLGDFYEMFDDDARTVSKELDLTLTTRDRGKPREEQTPMCGVPYHSSEAYIARLIAKGYKVAICEQLEDPALAKGIVDRDIVRIVTPGTCVDASMLDEGKSNYICAVYMDDAATALCCADISTGEIRARSYPAAESARLLNELACVSPAEAVLCGRAAAEESLTRLLDAQFHALIQTDEARFDYDAAAERVCSQFGAASLDELGLGDEREAVCAVGALLSYAIETQKADLSYINKLDFCSDGRYMELDLQTVRNLELLYSLRSGEKKGSLLWAMDKTRTPMGSRLIRAWVSRPLLSPAAIERRLNAVEELFSDNVTRPELAIALRGVGDMERIIGKAVYGTVNCRDLVSLASSINALPRVLELLEGKSSQLLREISSLDTLRDLSDLITQTICDEPPFSVREGGMIRDGFDPEVDRLRALKRDSGAILADIESRERARTGKKLRLGFNKVFGYYIEIPRSQSSDVPEDYMRKQTLVNCERFITPELKALETEILSAGERVVELEYELYCRLREKIAENVLRVQATSRLVAELDVLCSFAQCAAANDWCRPHITADGVVDIKDGRHPVVELMRRDELFVPNDTYLDTGASSLSIITGPNMAGKSTYMRQTALIVLMAQMGSFVPARAASLSIVDRVFTRIGASDDLSGGRSTFMVEMSEVSEILKNATARSLIILDEIGRGTSTYDGMAIARAVAEHCADKKRLGAKTMFATHYHELTELEGTVSGVKNYNISAKKRGNDIIFLRKIVAGGTDESYGVEVAHLAGVPESVVRRAKVILRELSSGSAKPARPTGGDESGQMSMELIRGDEVSEILRSTDLNTVTPLEALNLLYDLKKKVLV